MSKPQKSHLVLIKLGGSFVSNKSKSASVKLEAIHRFARQFAQLYTEHPTSVDFVLGNGAGSAHLLAHDYRLQEGATTSEGFYGMSVTHNNVRALNNLIAQELTDMKVPAFGLSPAGIMVYDQGKSVTQNLEAVRLLLHNHCVPVLHGDTVLDEARGTTIVSTEEVLLACLQYLKEDYAQTTVIYVMDTAGLLDANSQTIPVLRRDDTFSVLKENSRDVTGSISGKIASARKAAILADAVYLVDGNVPNILEGALRGRPAGTRVLP